MIGAAKCLMLVGQGAGALFTPSQITGLVGWYDPNDASTITSSAGRVSQLRDKSVSAAHLNQATGGNQPGLNTTKIAGSTLLNIDDGSRFVAGSWVIATGGSFSIVSLSLQMARDLYWIVTNGVGDTNNSWSLDVTSPGGQWELLTTGQAFAASPIASSDRIVTTQFDSSTGQGRLYFPISTGGGGAATALPSGENVFRLGWLTGIAGTAPGSAYTIGETIVFNKVLSTAERQKLEGYLAWKWGQTAALPSGHPYKNAAP